MMQENFKTYSELNQVGISNLFLSFLGSGGPGVSSKYESDPSVHRPFISILSLSILGIPDTQNMSGIPYSACLKEGLVFVSTSMGKREVIFDKI